MKLRKLVLVTVIIATLTILSGVMAFAIEDDNCTCMSVSPGATVDGSAMCTHTDDSCTDDTFVTIVPAKDWAPGTMRPVYENTDISGLCKITDPVYQTGEIPQVPHTYAYTNSAYTFQNEMGVGFGESTISQAKECINNLGMFEQTELCRVALERGATAREAMQVMGELGEKYGFRSAFESAGEMRAVIDKDEAWVYEMYSAGASWTPGCGKPGMVWIAQRVPDGEIAITANRSIIGAIDLEDTENFMGSSHIYSLAEELGLWDPESGIEFKVYDTYGKRNYGIGNSRRVWRAQDLLAPSLNLNPWVFHYPFSVKPDKKVTAQDLMAINRDYLVGTEFDKTQGLAAGPFGNPNRYRSSVEGYSSGERSIALPGANWSTVVVARKDMPPWIGALTWFGYDNEATTCYIPIYAGVTELPKSFAVGLQGGGYDVFNRESAWWAFNVVSNYAELLWGPMLEDIKAVRDPLEAEFFAIQPAIEKAALELYEQDPDLARTFITGYTNSCANRVVDAYWKLASQLFGRFNDGKKFADDVYEGTKSIRYPEWWVKKVNLGKTTIIPEGYPWYTIDQQKAPGEE